MIPYLAGDMWQKTDKLGVLQYNREKGYAAVLFFVEIIE